MPVVPFSNGPYAFQRTPAAQILSSRGKSGAQSVKT